MKKNEYLDEEKYQKNNKKVKKAGTIVILVGIIMIIIGSFVIKEPDRFAHNWLELSSLRSSLKMFGTFVTLVGCMIRFLFANQRQISAYQTQGEMPIAQESVEKMAPSMGVAAKEIAKGIKEGLGDGKILYCKYCGAQIDADSNFCNKCGKQL